MSSGKPPRPKPAPSSFLDGEFGDEDSVEWLDSEAGKALVRSGKWWAIVPKDVEFRYILRGIVRDYIGPRPSQRDLLILWPFDDNTELVLLSRARVPAIALSLRFGVDFAGMDPTKMVILAGTVEPPAKPTVSYWGEA